MMRMVRLLIVCFVGSFSCTRAPSPPRYDVELQIEQVAAGSREGISLYETVETDRIIERIAVQSPAVKTIYIQGTDITSEGLKAIARLPNLEVLDLGYDVGLPIEGITALTEAPSLRKVLYSGTETTTLNALKSLRLKASDDATSPNDISWGQVQGPSKVSRQSSN